MNNERSKRLVKTYGLTDDQQIAALERGRDVVVTAGAGSGKTRTLVARYASLLAEGHNPRRIAAITFTEKAAREMRSRIRDEIVKQAQNAEHNEERRFWLELNSKMDSARIGTIHSICAEILRNHPAEAGIDPRFDVLDDGLTAALRAQVVEETLSRFVDETAFAPLFESLTTSGMQKLLKFMLEHRLEMQEALANRVDGNAVLAQFLGSAISHPTIADAIHDLRSLTRAELEADGRLEIVSSLLASWQSAEEALQVGDVLGCAKALYQARREGMNLASGKRNSPIKDILSELQHAYDEFINPVVGGKSKAEQPNPETEARFTQLQPLCDQAFRRLSANYTSALAVRQALDFDDLEAGAARLLARDDVRTRWQSEVDGLLVDEFQDTNARQRQIVRALAGYDGRLFVVGDARQSIYRFRRADVTVFRELKREIERSGGLVRDLDRTYRAHHPLLEVTGDILSGIMGTEDDPQRPYHVPFTAMEADRIEAPKHIKDPHLEIIFGVSEETGDARRAMADSLAARLLELKNEKQICSWDEVALLFQASTGFIHYETAFEDAGIPFVTVAGRGFYDRPEIRDVINLLRAVSDPTDDLAMAGLLRSPAFGLTDAALYQLRMQSDPPVSYWQALHGDLGMLSLDDQARAQRVVSILTDIIPQVDRIPVAELLKQLMDVTDYRAILAAVGSDNAGGRLWRNLDKLLSDAQTSGQVHVRGFLDYLTTLSDAGAREGEAPSEAVGAVRLMTIHKSKGLQFPVVVLADASRKDINRGEHAYLLPETGLAIKLDPPPLLYRLAKWHDGRQDDSESVRVLYVALTRAQDKLIVNGHASVNQYGKWTSQGWMADVATHAKVDLLILIDHPAQTVTVQTANGHPVQAVAVQTSSGIIEAESKPRTSKVQFSDATPIYQPLPATVQISKQLDEPDQEQTWRATGPDAHVPPGVVGQMVHKAIERWIFPGDERLIPLLESVVLGIGIALPGQREKAIRRTVELLGRLRTHPLWDEINSAYERYHEVPYTRATLDLIETGYIDLLYKTSDTWQIVDFKTDSIYTHDIREKLVAEYRQQLARYKEAVKVLVGETPLLKICFLDCLDGIYIAEVI